MYKKLDRTKAYSKGFEKKRMRKTRQDEYGLGGAIGTGVGAVAGSVIPGVGNALGATVGGALGSGVDTILANRKASQGNNIEARRNALGTGSFYQGYATGGTVKGIGEKSVSFDGPSHEQGGIPISPEAEVEGNETMDNIKGKQYVFSDRLTVPNSNKTFAQRHKELQSQGATKEAIGSLAKVQERVAGREGQSAQGGKEMAYGGKMKMATGGYSPMFSGDPIEGEVRATGERFSPGYKPGIPKAPVDSFNKVNTPTLQFGMADRNNFIQGEVAKQSPQNSQNGMSDGMSIALQLAPDVINAATGIFGKDKTKQATQVPRTQIRRSYKGYNINPLLQSNNAGYRAILSNPNATINQKLAAQTNKVRGDQSAYAEKENRDQQAEMQYDLRQGQMDSYTNSQQASMNEQQRQDKMASEANLGVTGNFARQSYANIANKLLMKKREGNMSARDQKMLEMYRKIYGEI